MTTAYEREMQIIEELGVPLPHYDPHAVSVSLPLWEHVVGYEEGKSDVIGNMSTGYPRFRFHNTIQGLQLLFCSYFQWSRESLNRSGSVIQAFGVEKLSQVGSRSVTPQDLSFQALIFPCLAVGRRFEAFMGYHNEKETGMHSREVHLFALQATNVVVAIYPAEGAIKAKKYWQHTGELTSSRLAEHLLQSLLQHPSIELVRLKESSSSLKAMTDYDLLTNLFSLSKTELAFGFSFKAVDESSVWQRVSAVEIGDQAALSTISVAETADVDEAVLLQIKERIAAVINYPTEDSSSQSIAVTPQDILLTPTGMSAIFSAFRLIQQCYQSSLTAAPSPQFVVFGYPYLDTLKMLSRPEWNAGGVHFFGTGDSSDLDQLETLLARNTGIVSTKEESGWFANPIAAIFAEFPTNPLLKCSNLARLSSLAHRYGVLLVVDDTIGNYANINVLSHPEVKVDVLCTSLTKIVNGASNLMAGGVILNPHAVPNLRYQRLSQQYQQWLKEGNFPILSSYDAKVLEYNSRSFLLRSQIVNENGLALANFLSTHPAVQQVYYPSLPGRKEDYDRVKRGAPIPFAVIEKTFAEPDALMVDLLAKRREKEGVVVMAHEAGYGCLLSFELAPEIDVAVFHDLIALNKGPSLGTNFTLVSPYTLLAHYFELDWAKQYGVTSRLLRVSIGLEDTSELLRKFEEALQQASKVGKEGK